MLRIAILMVLWTGCSDATSPPEYELRLRAVGAAGESAVLIDVIEIVVRVDGSALAVRPGQRKFDLARADHAWLLATFAAPQQTEKVHVDILFDDFGAFEDPDTAGFIDAQGSQIGFDAPLAWLALHGRATVELDLERSLVVRARDERRLIPHARVLY